MARVRVPSFYSVVLLLAAACSAREKTGEASSQSALVPVSHPIVAIVAAISIDQDGRPIGPAATFAANAPQITVVAQTGEVKSSPMQITWSQLSADRPTGLFSHTVEVARFEAAYSVGKNPGSLAPGTYRVEATLDGKSVSTQFEVQAPKDTAATAHAATSGPPVQGNSGAKPTPVSTAASPSGGQPYASSVVMWAAVDEDPTTIDFIFAAGKPGGGATVEALAVMGGQTTTVRYPLTSAQDSVDRTLAFNPCSHPGGSDLPGTQASFEVRVVVLPSGTISGGVESTTLGPDTTRPSITMESQPPPGKVQPGARIRIQATAQEKRAGPTWQKGMKTFQLTATPGGQVGDVQVASSRLPLPCDRKQWSLVAEGSVVVPPNTPVVKVCAIAEDFAGNIQTKCNEYFTGEVWKGQAKISSSVVYPGPSRPTCRDGADLEFTFVASADGAIRGNGTAELTSAPTCPFPINAGSWKHVDYEVLGEKTATGFSLRFAAGAWQPPGGINWAGFVSVFGVPALPTGGAPVAVNVSGTRGTGQGMWQFQSGNPPATYSASGPVTIECVQCEEPVG